MIETELGSQAFWLLLLVGALFGVLSVWVFRHRCDTQKLQIAGNQLLAHLFEFHLFASEPALVVKAQRDLIVSNARLLRILVRPTLILLLPYAVLLVAAEAFFGHAPLRTGKATVVTMQIRNSNAGDFPSVHLIAPSGIEVETPPVRIPADRQISWRVRPVRESSGELRILQNGRVTSKSISAISGLQWLSDRRASLGGTLFHPFELPLSGPNVDSVSVVYPAATVLHVHWIVWFSIGSLAGACIAYMAAL